MPNWCENTNTYWTTTAQKDELERFFRFLQTQNASQRKDGGLTWLADLLDASGLSSDAYDCRGYLTYLSPSLVEKEGRVFFELDTDTAWTPMEEAMEALLKDYPHVHLSYIAEELGTGLFVTNDQEGDFFQDAWRIECILDGDEETCEAVYEKYPLLMDDGASYLTEEEGLRFLQELFHLPGTPKKQLLDMLPEKIAAFKRNLLKEFQRLEDCDLAYQHVEYV
ncbi:hypothetical protein [Megasphaera elsdenii]